MLEDPKNFSTFVFENFKKKVPKMTFLGPGKYQKDQSHEFWWAYLKPYGKGRLIPDVGAIMAPPHVE